MGGWAVSSGQVEKAIARKWVALYGLVMKPEMAEQALLGWEFPERLLAGGFLVFCFLS
jgi:cytochrome c-type biogenesis protein CcmH/NrfF